MIELNEKGLNKFEVINNKDKETKKIIIFPKIEKIHEKDFLR